MGLEVLALKILVFALFTAFVLWLFLLLTRTPESEVPGPEPCAAKGGKVQVHKLEDWRGYK